jgi:dTDP-glucose 4,6-dehydratase
MKKVLITGGAGFIGHYLVKEFLKDHTVVCIIRPGSKNLDRLVEVKDKIEIIYHDIKNSYDSIVDQLKDVKVILHAGANPSSESSILDPVSVVMDNVVGTIHLLELSRKLDIERFVYFGAGESFGPIKPGTDSGENDAYNSVSPYAASKAGGEELCISYAHTFGIPVSVIHLTNTFGQRSQSKRFPVIAIKKILDDDTLELHIDENNLIGGRRWIHAEDVALHTRFLLNNQKHLYEKWNTTGNKFISNLEFAENIASILRKKLKYKLVPIQRQGHNTYFSMTPEKFYRLGWKEDINIYDRLTETVNWYKENTKWLTDY